MLLLVRHADAGVKGSWDGPDALRPLSPMGRRQAEGLVVRLEDYPVDRILCSPTARCHQTVQPLAGDRLLRIERIAALGVDASPADVLGLVLDRQLRNAGAVRPLPGPVGPRRPRGGRLAGFYPGRTLMALAMTRIAITSDSDAWTIMVSLAHRLTGRVSVGLNAVALVNDRYR